MDSEATLELSSIRRGRVFAALEKWPHRMEYLRQPSADTGGARVNEEYYHRIDATTPTPGRSDSCGILAIWTVSSRPSCTRLRSVSSWRSCARPCSPKWMSPETTRLPEPRLTTPLSEEGNNQEAQLLGNSILKLLVSVFIIVKCKQLAETQTIESDTSERAIC